MRPIKTIFNLTSILLLFSCNNVDKTNIDNSQRPISQTANKSAKTEKVESELKELYTDSINNLTLGDCFILKTENLSKGFVLTRIRKDLYDFTPVKLDSTKKGLDKFSSGNFRMVPLATMTGVIEEWGTECLSLMGQEDVKEFLNTFKKIGHLEFKEQTPKVSSSSYLSEYTSKKLNSFFRQREMMWINNNKTVDLDSFIVKK